MKFRNVLRTIVLALVPIVAFSQNETPDVVKLSLVEAQDYALEHSYDSRKATQDVFYAQKQVWEATATGLPQIDGSAGYNYNVQQKAMVFGDQVILMGTKNDMSASLSASQLIFDGSYIVGLQSAKTVEAISELAKDKTDILVKEAVANAYIGVLVSEESEVIIQRNISTVQDNIMQTKALFENGLAEEQDVDQLQLTLSSLLNTQNKNKRMVKINYEMLKFVLGMNISQPIILSENIDQILLSNYQITALNEALNLEGHVDYQISENKLKTDDLLVKYEKTKYMPNISAFFNAGYDSYSEIFDFFEFRDDQWFPSATVGLTLNIPIFSSFQRKARVDMAKIDMVKSQTDHEQLIQNLFMELHTSQDAYAYSIDNFLTNKGNMELAAKIENKESIKYQEGISTSLDLANAQRQLYTSQENYLNAILLVVQSKVALDKALNKL